MSEFVKIRYENSVEDLIVFNRYHWAHTPRLRRMRRFLIWAPALMVLVPAAGLAVWVQIPVEFVVAAVVVLLALYLLLAPGAFNRSMERQIRRAHGSGDRAAILGEHELELTQTSLVERTATEETVIDSRALREVVTTPTHTLIYLSEDRAHVIPRGGVLQGDYDAFAAAVADFSRQIK